MNSPKADPRDWWPDTQAQEIPDPADGSHLTIGDILRRQKNFTPAQIEQILLLQRERGLKFGQAAVRLNLASESDVLWALSQQFHYPYSAENSSSQFSSELVVAANPFGAQAEVFRDIRSQIMLGPFSGEEGRRALALISPDVGDGKSFFASNLAISFSQLGGRTLLVDADMRTPRQHEIFGVEAEDGLSTILAGRSTDRAILAVPDLPNLYLLPVGIVPPNPLELVQRPAFTLLLHELLAKFDFVLVDTPACVHGSDSRVIASKCGSALAIARRGRTRTRAMEELVQNFRKGPSTLAGVVFNDH